MHFKSDSVVILLGLPISFFLPVLLCVFFFPFNAQVSLVNYALCVKVIKAY